ncbi:hypothetical protein [Micromonospora sp. NPDC005174]|uniref:hypothetical protein n=1 Tax=Micromonospora sp. NPDC005174 TaxID=3157018 RepID=UPI0033A2F2D3
MIIERAWVRVISAARQALLIPGANATAPNGFTYVAASPTGAVEFVDHDHRRDDAGWFETAIDPRVDVEVIDRATPSGIFSLLRYRSTCPLPSSPAHHRVAK